MKTTIEEGRKIPFLFTPVPNFLFKPGYFENANLVRFMFWALHRTTFGACGEFVFGRQQCSKETGISEQRLRTIINQLTNQQLIQKVTGKSTNKYTVYKWIWEHFPGFINHQSNGKSTVGQPQTNHNTELDIEKEQQQRTKSAPLTAAAALLEGKAKKQFDLLPQQERAAITALYHQRLQTQVIANPEAWFIKCIEESWHLESKFVLPDEKIELSDFEKNKAHAQKLIRHFESIPGLHICLRNDFLELGKDRRDRWQIFFSEPSKAFLEQIELVLKKIHS